MLACCLETSTIHNNVIAGISSNLNNSSNLRVTDSRSRHQSPHNQCSYLSGWLSMMKLLPVLAKMPAKSCLLDPVPTRLICKVLILVVCSLGNASFQHSLVAIVCSLGNASFQHSLVASCLQSRQCILPALSCSHRLTTKSH